MADTSRAGYHYHHRVLIQKFQAKSCRSYLSWRPYIFLTPTQSFNPIPICHGRNQPIYECHVTTAVRNRVKPPTLWLSDQHSSHLVILILLFAGKNVPIKNLHWKSGIFSSAVIFNSSFMLVQKSRLLNISSLAQSPTVTLVLLHSKGQTNCTISFWLKILNREVGSKRYCYR